MSDSPSEPLANTKHERFAQFVADGKSETDAYLNVYGCTKRVAKSAAPRLLSKVVVRARVDWLLRKNAEVSALSREESMQILAEIARNAENKITTQSGVILAPDYRARISAIQENNRMNGWSADNLNVKGEGIVFNLGKVLGGNGDKR